MKGGTRDDTGLHKKDENAMTTVRFPYIFMICKEMIPCNCKPAIVHVNLDPNS